MDTNSPSALEGLQVLVVDDHADTRDMLAALLKMNGADILVLATAREAFETLKAQRPDVLVSDIGMPDEDGYMLIKRVRNLKADEGGDIPAIALTGYIGSGEGERALLAGYQMHIPKPVEPEKLVKAISFLTSKNGKGKGA